MAVDARLALGMCEVSPLNDDDFLLMVFELGRIQHISAYFANMKIMQIYRFGINTKY